MYEDQDLCRDCTVQRLCLVEMEMRSWDLLLHCLFVLKLWAWVLRLSDGEMVGMRRKTGRWEMNGVIYGRVKGLNFEMAPQILGIVWKWVLKSDTT